MNIAEDVDPEDRFAYPNRPAWQRFVTIFAGPGTNYVSAVLLAFALYSCHGVRSPWKWFGVADLRAGYDAKGKLEVGDRIIAVDDRPILADGEYTPPNGGPTIKADPSDTLMARVNAHHGGAVKVTVVRDGKQLDFQIQPKPAVVMFGATAVPMLQPNPPAECLSESAIERFYVPIGIIPIRLRCDEYVKTFFLIGIANDYQADFLDVGLFTAARGALEYPILQTKLIGEGLYGIFSGKEKADPGGPKRIFDEFEKAWKLGWVSGIELLMMLSVYLGLFNLFPLPALDGGRLVFLGYELITRRRANPKIEAMVHMGGIMVLAVVMVLVTLRDFHVFG
jgi:regulator of sigma E protease